MKLELEQKIEAILFYTAEAVSKKDLAKITESTKEDVEAALNMLGKSLSQRGIRLVQNGDEVLLSTAPEHSSLIEKMIKEERSRDLGRAGMETLSIIAYKGPVSKKEIEYVRGVNSDYALRTLLIRGLVEKKANEHDERSSVYIITFETLLHLGIERIEQLPEYETMKKALEVKEDSEIEDNSDMHEGAE